MSVTLFHCTEDPGKCIAFQFLADTGVNGQGRAHIHRVADGITDDGVRAMDAPSETVSCRREDLVLLRVVEILNVEPWLLLTKWSSGKLPLPYASNGPR